MRQAPSRHVVITVLLMTAAMACRFSAGADQAMIVFEPQINEIGRTSEITEFDITGDTPDGLAEKARRASWRIGYGKPPLRFRANFRQQGRMAMRITRASRGGATLRVTVRDLIYEMNWPRANATHIIGHAYFIPLPPRENEIVVAAPTGVVVISRYVFYATDKQPPDEVMFPMPSGAGNAWRAPGDIPEAAGMIGELRERAPGHDASRTSPGWPYNLSPHDSGMLIEDVWPSIYFGQERVDEIRRKTETLPWAKVALEQMKREAEAVLKTEPVQPIEKVGWRHDFYSRATAEHLVHDPNSPDRFLDPWTGQYESDPAQHRAWVLLTHERTHRLMRSLGILYALTGDERYAQWVAEGMRRAVEMFKHRELREGNNTEALYFQPLYDAPALMMLADAYEMTRQSSVYSADDHEAIRTGIFEEGMPYQIEFLDKIGVHNMSCFVAAALGKAGFLFERDDWLQRGLAYEKNDLRQLLMDGVRAGQDGEVDGFWFEGTMFYHFYSLCPLVTLFELDRRYGGKASADEEVRRRFEAMFGAPVALADQRLRLPTLGDLGAPKVMGLPLYRHLYEYAAGQISAERFGPTLAAIYAQGYPRNSLTALAFGPDVVFPSPERRGAGGEATSSLLKRPGIGVMRAPGDWHLLFKAGPHGAGHDHPDKLQIAFNALGHVIAPDLGTAGYALGAIHPYYRSTFSHNTLFVDEADQKPVSDASLIWEPNADPPFAQGTIRDAYEGVTFTRRVWFDPPYIILGDECVSEQEHRYGWIFHAYGSLDGGVSVGQASRLSTDAPPSLPEIGPLKGYLKGAQVAWTEGQLEANWRIAQGLWLRLVATSDGPFEATLGRTPGNPMPDDQGVAIMRAVGKDRRFWAVFEVHGGTPNIAEMATGEEGIRISLANAAARSYTHAEQ